MRSILTLVALATATPALATEFIECGAEGDTACGVFEDDGIFWANGSGFCDTALRAEGFEVLPDINSFRANEWVDLRDISDKDIPTLIAEGEALVRDIKYLWDQYVLLIDGIVAFIDDPRSGLSIGTFELCFEVCDPTGITDECIEECVDVPGPEIAGVALDAIATSIRLAATLVDILDELEDITLFPGLSAPDPSSRRTSRPSTPSTTSTSTASAGAASRASSPASWRAGSTSCRSTSTGLRGSTSISPIPTLYA